MNRRLGWRIFGVRPWPVAAALAAWLQVATVELCCGQPGTLFSWNYGEGGEGKLRAVIAMFKAPPTPRSHGGAFKSSGLPNAEPIELRTAS